MRSKTRNVAGLGNNGKTYIELNTTYILKHLRNAREDYLISNVGDQVDGQLRNRIEYYLHPETSKKCSRRLPYPERSRYGK